MNFLGILSMEKILNNKTIIHHDVHSQYCVQCARAFIVSLQVKQTVVILRALMEADVL